MIEVNVRCDTKLVTIEAHPCETLKSIAAKAARRFGLYIPFYAGFGELSPFALKKAPGAANYLPGKLTLRDLHIEEGPVKFWLWEVRT